MCFTSGPKASALPAKPSDSPSMGTKSGLCSGPEPSSLCLENLSKKSLKPFAATRPGLASSRDQSALHISLGAICAHGLGWVCLPLCMHTQLNELI